MVCVVARFDEPDALVRALGEAGVVKGTPLALVLATDGHGDHLLGTATSTWRAAMCGARVLDAVAAVESAIRPRWVWWSNEPVSVLVRHGVRPGACWDLSAVHRLLVGGWRTDEVRIWSATHGLDHRSAPALGQLDLGDGDSGDGRHPAVRADGHLRAEWVSGSWRDDPEAAADGPSWPTR